MASFLDQGFRARAEGRFVYFSIDVCFREVPSDYHINAWPIGTEVVLLVRLHLIRRVVSGMPELNDNSAKCTGDAPT